MRLVPILIIGSLCVASMPVVTAAQSRDVFEMRDAAGPLEKLAKPLAPITQSRRKPSELPAYPWELRRTGARAALIVQVTVNDSGRVMELRRMQGPLIQPAIGSTADAEAQRTAADAVVRSTSPRSLASAPVQTRPRAFSSTRSRGWRRPSATLAVKSS